MPTTTIDRNEAAHFGAMAADWWDPKGSSAMLHRLNPVRLGFIRRAIDRHWRTAPESLRPLTGRTALDVGCGAGLMTEPLARLGASVTGLDAAPESIAVAQVHADAQGLPIRYEAADVATFPGQFDLVTSMEVIEHVTDPGAFVGALAARLGEGGLLILSTPNRSTLSRIGLIGIGETIGGIPKGTHDWDKFITPEDLITLADAAGLHVVDRSGLSLNPARGFVLSEDERLNYLLALAR